MKYLYLFILFPISIYASENIVQTNLDANNASNKNRITLENDFTQTQKDFNSLKGIAEEIKNQNKQLLSKLISKELVINDLSKKLDGLNLRNKQLASEINTQQNSINKITQLIEESNFFKDFIYPIFLSIIAAIIFWFAFVYLPERSRHKKIRIKVDLNLYQIYLDIFYILDLVMSPNTYSPSYYQDKIKGNKLDKNDIELGLQNKCLNEQYMYDKNVKDLFIPIGKKLYEKIKKIDLIIERIFNFNFYINPEEVLLLEKIRTQINTYDLENFNKQPFTIIGSMTTAPVNQTLSYMTHNIFGLFQLYIKMQDIVHGPKFTYTKPYLGKIQHYFLKGEYDKCIDEIYKFKNKSSKDKHFLELNLFQAEYMKGKRDSAYARLNSLLASDKPILVTYRGFLKNIISDEKIRKILNKYYSDKEVVDVYSVIEKEKILKEDFIKRANFLRHYFKNKTENIKPN